MGYGPLLKPSEKKPVRLARTRYETLKTTIRTWWEDRFKVGAALLEIRDDKLYRGEHETFEAFCESEYGFKRAHAYRLIEFAEVKASVQMSPIGDKLQRESQARALASVPAEKRVDVLTEAAKTGPVTAKSIDAVKRNGNKSKPENVIDLDKTGCPIPDRILEDWKRADQSAREWMTKVSQVRSELRAALDEEDVIVSGITNDVLADLNNAYTSLKCIQPYAVCSSCQGVQSKKCELCKGRGFLDHFAWKTFVPEETRKLRETK